MPAFATLILIPLTFSITQGILWGFILHARAARAGRPRPRGDARRVGAGGGLGIAFWYWNMPTELADPRPPPSTNSRRSRSSADKAIEQLSDEQLHITIDPESNSVAIIMRHMAGNMRSRWIDFLTSDGEKPDAHARSRIRGSAASRAQELMAEWEHGWQCVFDALTPLTDADLQRTVMIRSEPHTSTRRSAARWRTTPATPTRSCFLGQALQGRGVEDAVDPARPVRGVQPPHAANCERKLKARQYCHED